MEAKKVMLYTPPEKKGLITITDLDSESITIELSNFPTPSNGRYHYEVAIGQGLTTPWIDIGKSTTYTKKGLKPLTRYTVWAKMVPDYGGIITANPVNFTTPEQTTVFLNVFGEYKKGKLFLNQNGIWKKANKVYVKKNGRWINN